MAKKDRWLLGLLIFNAISATGGGLALMAGVIKQPSWTSHTGFTSLYFPGLILFAMVGGSALVAALALIKKLVNWQLVSLLAGVIMLFWIVGEIISIRQFHWLQVIYAATALIILYLTLLLDESHKNKF